MEARSAQREVRAACVHAAHTHAGGIEFRCGRRISQYGEDIGV